MFDFQLVLAIGGGELSGLFGRHLGIGVAVDEEEGRVLGIEVEDGAGELGEVGFGFGLAAEEKLEGGHANFETMRGALTEDGGEIGGAVETDDALDGAALIRVSADGAFEIRVAVGDADEGCEMATCGCADNDDAFGVDQVCGLAGAEEADGGFDIVNVGGERGFGGEFFGADFSVGDVLVEHLGLKRLSQQ